jgi:hypothetical protein
VLKDVVTGSYNTTPFQIARCEAFEYGVSNKPIINMRVIRINLKQQFPHIVLDSRQNNSLLASNLPVQYKKSQILELEGDFSRYFTLYTSEDFRRDVYYIFSPDMMVFFIDRLAYFDIEIKDNSLYLYTPFSSGGSTLRWFKMT